MQPYSNGIGAVRRPAERAADVRRLRERRGACRGPVVRAAAGRRLDADTKMSCTLLDTDPSYAMGIVEQFADNVSTTLRPPGARLRVHLTNGVQARAPPPTRPPARPRAFLLLRVPTRSPPPRRAASGHAVGDNKSTPPFTWKDYVLQQSAAQFRLHAARASVPDPTLAKCTTPQSATFPYPWAAGDECVTYSVDEKVGPAWNAGACPGIPDAAHTGGNWFDAAWNRFSTSDCNLTLALLGPPVVAECHDRGDGTAGCILAMPAQQFSAYMECEIEGECTTADQPPAAPPPPAPVQTWCDTHGDSCWRLVTYAVLGLPLLIVLLFPFCCRCCLAAAVRCADRAADRAARRAPPPPPRLAAA